MKKVLFGASLLALSACGGSGVAIPTLPSSVDLSGAINTAKNLCVSGQPILVLAQMIPNPQVQTVAAFVSGVCGPLLAGSVPTTLDANTPNWLSQNLGALAKLVGK